MRDFTSPELAYLQNRTGYRTHILLYVLPRDRGTNARVPLGFWTGEEDRTFTIGGQARIYLGGGAIGEIDPIMMQPGLNVRAQRLTMSPLHAGVVQFLRANDPFRAPAELHRALFDPLNDALIAEPRRLWKGLVHGATIQTPPIGGEARAEVTLTSAADTLKVGMTTTRSDAAQSQRGGDRFFRHKDVDGTARYTWGG